VGKEAVYLFPEGRVIDDRYAEKALLVIHEQLAKAAVRLAVVLNWALGQSERRQRGLAGVSCAKCTMAVSA